MNFSPAPINVRACGKDKQMNVAFLGPEVCARRALERNRPDCRIAGDLPPKFRTVDYLRDWLPTEGAMRKLGASGSASCGRRTCVVCASRVVI